MEVIWKLSKVNHKFIHACQNCKYLTAQPCCTQQPILHSMSKPPLCSASFYGEHLSTLVDLAGKTSMTSHVSKLTFQDIPSFREKLYSYIVSDTGKFYEILSCYMENFRELCLLQQLQSYFTRFCKNRAKNLMHYSQNACNQFFVMVIAH